MAIKYREFLESVSQMAGLDYGMARAAAEATLTSLARALSAADQARLLEALPAEFKNDFPMTGGPRDWDQKDFVREVSLLGRRPKDQARLRAQAVLAALAEHEPELVSELRLPGELRALFAPPAAGGGIYGPTGHAAPLTAEEVRAALRNLPEWSGDTHALRRTIAMPPENLDRVLERIQVLRERVGRGPAINRGTDTAELVVRTAAIGAVTALDIDLAALIDETITAAGSGMAGT
jgi:uncharacterized protein (DUF2267 family)/pterin-4a-carbinolamine dehydratase